MTVSAKAFSFLSSHAEAIVRLFSLLPFCGASENNTEVKAYLGKASSVIAGGTAPIESFGIALARASPAEIMQGCIIAETDGEGVSNAFPAILFPAEAESFSLGEGMGYAFDAAFGKGQTESASQTACTGWAFFKATGEGKSVSKSDTRSNAWAFTQVQATSDAPSQTDAVGIAHDHPVVYSSASHSIVAEAISTGYAVDSLPMKGKAQLSTGGDALPVLIRTVPMKGKAESFVRMQGSGLTASATVGAGDGQSKNDGKGTMNVWLLPILAGYTLKIRQAYNVEFTDGVLKII
ncbi:MAG: hypothetical protein IJD10_05325 [Clostridia bacterium]|nr:hypothetical protein [Clostridia bacterium]